MKRDWDLIREVLLEIEQQDVLDQENLIYEVSDETEFSVKAQHAVLLWRSGFLEGADATSLAGPALLNPTLTWAGHNLLDTLRSKPLWEKIKAKAAEKGIELSFDAVTLLAKTLLPGVFGLNAD